VNWLNLIIPFWTLDQLLLINYIERY